MYTSIHSIVKGYRVRMPVPKSDFRGNRYKFIPLEIVFEVTLVLYINRHKLASLGGWFYYLSIYVLCRFATPDRSKSRKVEIRALP